MPSLLKGSLLSLAQAATEHGQQGKPDIGVVVQAPAQETTEFPERELQHGDLVDRRDRRRAGQIIQERYLANDIPRSCCPQDFLRSIRAVSPRDAYRPFAE